MATIVTSSSKQHDNQPVNLDVMVTFRRCEMLRTDETVAFLCIEFTPVASSLIYVRWKYDVSEELILQEDMINLTTNYVK